MRYRDKESIRRIPGVIHYAPLDEAGGLRAFDALKRVNGTITSMGRSFTGDMSNTGKATRFNGTGYIDFGTSAILNPLAMSIFACVKVNLSPTYTAIFSRVSSSGGAGPYQFFIRSNGKLALYSSTWGSYDGTGTYTLSSGKWYVLGFSYDSGAGLRGYVNGLVDNTVAPSGTLFQSSVNTQIGNDANTAGRVLTGAVKHYLTFNRPVVPTEAFDISLSLMALLDQPYPKPKFQVPAVGATRLVKMAGRWGGFAGPSGGFAA